MNTQSDSRTETNAGRRWPRRLVGLLVLVMLTGCGPKFLDGYVVTKEFKPAHTYVTTTVVMAGKTPVATSTVHHVPDKWYITLAREKFGNEMETIEVTRETYEAAKRGEMAFLE